MLQLYATSVFYHHFGFEQLSRHKSRDPDKLDADYPSAFGLL
jgi:hypothetical protein